MFRLLNEISALNPSQSKNRWIASLCSFIVHLALLIVLAIWTVVGVGIGSKLTIYSGQESAQSDTVETVELATENDTQESSANTGPSSLTTTTISSNQSSVLEPGAEVDTNPQASLTDMIQLSGASSPQLATGFLELSLDSRTAANRPVAAVKHGATPASEKAVEMALAYLARHQKNNGAWSLGTEVCEGECTDGCEELDRHEIAGTGLALLCFLGAGHTMNQGEYSDHVSKGIYFLLQTMQFKPDGQGYWLTEVAHAQMYEHGMATLALCEALQMTGDTSLRGACEAAVKFIFAAQHTDGGWNYHPKGPGDLSIVGWQMLALKSASAAKIPVPYEVLRECDKFLESQVAQGFMYKYRKQAVSDSMTAIGNLIRLFRGWSTTDGAILRAQSHIAKAAPSVDDVYYNYYATQFMFHLGGPRWQNWNAVMRELLVNSQVKQGHMSGSWFFERNPFNRKGGRLYVTAMCCLTLEVYYRCLPVYENSSEEFRF